MFTTIDAIRGTVFESEEAARQADVEHLEAQEQQLDHGDSQQREDAANEQGKSRSGLVEFYKFRAHHSAIKDIQVSDNCIFTASDDRSVKIWSNDEFCLKKTLKGHSHVLSDISLAQDYNHMLTSSYDRTIRLWDLEKYESSRVFRGHENAVLSVAMSKDNRVIVSGGADNKVLMWNVKGQIKSESRAHTGFVNQMQFNPSFKDIVYSCSEDGTAVAYNLENMMLKPYATITGNGSPVIDLNSSPDGSLAALITHNEVLFYESCMGEYIASYKLPSKELNHKNKMVNISGSCVRFNPTEVWIGYTFGHNLQVHYLGASKLIASFSILNEVNEVNCSANFTKFTWTVGFFGDILYSLKSVFDSYIYSHRHAASPYFQWNIYYYAVLIGVCLGIIFAVGLMQENALASLYYLKYREILDRAKIIEILRRKINAKLLILELEFDYVGEAAEQSEIRRKISPEIIDLHTNLFRDSFDRAVRLSHGFADKIAENIVKNLE
ncbi:MAG: hypothetical protein MHMPM18_002815 [Marteilia pararefringens]